MKKVMILGAGIYQVPLIKQAKAMGIYTIVVSIKGNYPGFDLADKVYYEDTTDYDKVLDIARKEKIDGIVTAGTDVAVITIGKVCDALGLSGLSFESANIASNKMLMKEKFVETDVRTARFKKVPFDINLVKTQISSFSMPLVFKAVDSSGSRGIIKVNSADEFADAMEYTRSATKLDYFIAEEYLEGDEFGAQAFVQNGEVKFILPHGDYVFKGDTGVPIGHYAPIDITDDILKDTEDQLKKAVKAMKLNNCAINADFMLVNGKCYVLELGGRSGATCLAELTSIYYGFNYYEKLILACMGDDVDFESKKRIPNASMLLMSDKNGVILSQKNNNENDDRIVDVQFDYNIGDAVKKFKVGPDRIGHIITKGNTLDEAVEVLEKARENTVIDIK